MGLHLAVLVARPNVIWRDRDDELTLLVRIVNNNGLCILGGVGSALLALLYVGVLFYMKWRMTVGLILLPFAFFAVLAYAIYRAVSPIEEYTFRRDGYCKAKSIGLCSTQNTELRNVSGVQATLVSFGDSLLGGGRTSQALKLSINHAEGVHVSETMWPCEDTKLAEVALVVNEFLGAPCVVVTEGSSFQSMSSVPSAIVTKAEDDDTSTAGEVKRVHLVDVDLNDDAEGGVELQKRGGGGGAAAEEGLHAPSREGHMVAAEGEWERFDTPEGTPSSRPNRTRPERSNDMKGLVQEAHKGAIGKIGDGRNASMNSPRTRASLANMSPNKNVSRGKSGLSEKGGAAASSSSSSPLLSSRSFTELARADSKNK